MQQHPHPARFAHGPAQLFQHLAAHFGRQRVGVAGQQLHAVAAQLLELRRNAPHGAAPIPVQDAQIHAVGGELVGRGQPEAARAPQYQRPVAAENRAHCSPSGAPPRAAGAA